jgi:hypothetical protein
MPHIRRSLLALFVVAAVSAAPTRAADIEKYLSDETDGVVTIDLKGFFGSALAKKLGLDKSLGDDKAARMLKEVGLDPAKDIDRAVIGLGAGNQKVIVLEGKFDPAKMEAKLEEIAKEKKDFLTVHKTEKGKVFEIAKLDELIKLPDLASGIINLKGEKGFIAIPDKGHAILAQSQDALAEAIAKGEGKKTTKLKNRDLAALIGKMESRQTVSVALTGSTTGLEKTKSITGGIEVAADVKLGVVIAAEDTDAAKATEESISDQLGQFRAILQQACTANKGAYTPIIDVLKSIKTESKDRNVQVSTTLTGEAIEKLVKALASLAESLK